MRKIIIIALFVIFVSLIALESTNPIFWQDLKLKSTRYWGLGTISNNPLLSGSDVDLQETEYQETGITPRIDTDKLFSGGPPKDGIPSIDDPQFEPISETEFSDDELIIGLEINGDARAYPYAILNWHEIVNDTVGETPVAVTYCPLCETNSVFVRELDSEIVEFGVSGKLYESCLVMYDRKTDTLYSQPWGIGIVGEKTNHVLERVDATRTTVGQWREQYPDSQILTTDTGYNRDYSRYPYGSYYINDDLVFPARNQDQLTEHPKEITQIIFEHDSETPTNQFSGRHHAFTQKEIKEKGTVNFTYIQGAPESNAKYSQYYATWDEKLKTIVFTDPEGNTVPNTALFNFVLPAHFE